MLISIALATALNTIALILSITAIVILTIWLWAGSINLRWPAAVNAVLLTAAASIWTFTNIMAAVSFVPWVGVLAIGLFAAGHILMLIRPPA